MAKDGYLKFYAQQNGRLIEATVKTAEHMWIKIQMPILAQETPRALFHADVLKLKEEGFLRSRHVYSTI